jgi:Ca2+-binding EF-hand superfamily protein
MFKYFDIDKNNSITKNNLKEIFAREGKNIPE